ncbi:hypothetical protein LGM43_35435 [Burkholderia seminalis]|uniref:hypothetical protein n=1 Tax=Burkholderia seminalis TaxID=488731 RepID=UPI001CF542D6|nr:hypothetical protein [Burkholderia seminalis]MCA7955558.1 hypothetical protein [Burkholderia seminalis]
MDDGVMFGRAVAAPRSAEQWKAYAAQLEDALRICQANTAGMQALKDAAIKELAKVDPGNYLLMQANRQKIFDSAFDHIAKQTASR